MTPSSPLCPPLPYCISALLSELIVMPLANLHLISLNPSTSLKSFLCQLQSLPGDQQPITISKVVRWIITPEIIDTNQLLHPEKPYDVLLIFPNTNPLPSSLTSHIHNKFSLQVGIPSRLLKDFKSTNQSLLHPSTSTIPPLTGALSEPLVQKSSQSLALSPELQTWIKSYSTTLGGKSAVSMLNLLAFIPERKSSYLQYGKAFAESIGSKRGGNAKLVGHAIYPSSSTSNSNPDSNSPTTSSPSPSGHPISDSETSNTSEKLKWDEFALAHYPSITHFADMLASKDYQDVNQKYRVPSLKDTCILCTSEIEAEDIMGAAGQSEKAKAKL